MSNRDRFSFKSPVATSLDELVKLRGAANALQRRVRRKSAAPMNGGSVSRRLGRGLDFSEVREYQPGDDVRMIDWKVTARTGSAQTKLFVEERERPVLLVVDQSSSMRFGTGNSASSWKTWTDECVSSNTRVSKRVQPIGQTTVC